MRSTQSSRGWFPQIARICAKGVPADSADLRRLTYKYPIFSAVICAICGKLSLMDIKKAFQRMKGFLWLLRYK